MADVFVSHLEWTGSSQGATVDPKTFSRDLEVTLGPMALPMSSAPTYRGDASRLNPEQLFVASLSSCHALTYLFLAARAGVAVTGYVDDAEGVLEMVEGRMRMSRVILRPRITVETAASEEKARDLLENAHRGCFITNSVSTMVTVEARIDRAAAAG